MGNERNLEADCVDILRALDRFGYQFTAVTPATHGRIIKRFDRARDLRGVFGWNLPFGPDPLPPELRALLERGSLVEPADAGLVKSRVRVASVGSQLFVHSSYPTDDEDAVFFGPDTYRFINLLHEVLPGIGQVRRLVDLGCGTGAGGIIAALEQPAAEIVLSDVNETALRFASANARHAGVEAELVLGKGLSKVEGEIDLVICNPPYIMDDGERTYRHGGGMHGAEVSLDWTKEAAQRLTPGGHVILYTGVAIVDGRDDFRAALQGAMEELGCSLSYREIDPDIFGEELEEPSYHEVERIAAVGAVIQKKEASAG
jgi:methylase of polypeptide subunit release factors